MTSSLCPTFPPRHTGLPFVVWISPKGGAQHDVRVKVSRDLKVVPGEFITVTVQPTIAVVNGTLSHRDLTLLRKWIELNRDVLIRFWDRGYRVYGGRIGATAFHLIGERCF